MFNCFKLLLGGHTAYTVALLGLLGFTKIPQDCNAWRTIVSISSFMAGEHSNVMLSTLGCRSKSLGLSQQYQGLCMSSWARDLTPSLPLS